MLGIGWYGFKNDFVWLIDWYLKFYIFVWNRNF